MLRNSATTYGTVAKFFHWSLFLFLTVSIVMGNLLAEMPQGADKLQAATLHKSFGAILMIVIMFRLFWRLLNETPRLPKRTTAIQATLAKAMHWVLYILMFAQPVSGMLMSQLSGNPVSFFGLFEFPAFFGQDPDLATFFHTMHGTIWILMVVAVFGHVGAALHHHFVSKDKVLKQMTWG